MFAPNHQTPSPSRRQALQAAAAALLPCGSWAADAVAPFAGAECIAPSKPGGGFDLTCAVASQAIARVRPQANALHTRYLPGGIGAVAFDQAASGRLGGPGTLVAFSSGSLLNIAQGRFGPHPVQAVRWIATLGTDYGVVAVHRDSPHYSLPQLVQALREAPSKQVFGAGGTLGSQDWMKASLLTRASGQDPKRMRFVSFEGGGEAMTALMGGHVQVYSGDASEVAAHLKGGRVRVLAVLAPERLPGELAAIPTAIEQGYKVDWTIARGYYVGPKVADADYAWWVATFDKMLASPEFDKLRAERGLFPFARTGAAATDYVKQEVQRFKKLAVELGLTAQ